MSDVENIVMHIVPGSHGVFHIESDGDLNGRSGVLIDDGDAFYLKVDAQGRVWFQAASNYRADENRPLIAGALHATAKIIEDGGPWGG